MKGRAGFRWYLRPLTPLYRAALAWREMRLDRGWEPVRRLRFPVISIGNLSTGGRGKDSLRHRARPRLDRAGLRGGCAFARLPASGRNCGARSS